MLNLSPHQISEVSFLAFISDREVRNDLSIGMIKDENDYTSNFTGAFRRNINCYSITGARARSLLLPHPGERNTGCDATIIIQAGNHTKIALFEAKFPRLAQSNYSWDYQQTATGLSHYSDQLDRQAPHSSEFAIFEMFYCEQPFYKQPSYMQAEVSSCVWHEDALSFKNGRSDPDSVWSRSDLESLLKQDNSSICQMMREICSCNKGRAFPIRSAQGAIGQLGLAGNILIIDFPSVTSLI